MTTDLVDLYRKSSEWAITKIDGASQKLDASTPCDDWNVEQLLNHMLATQRYFLNSAQGKEAQMPMGEPPSIISNNPKADFEQARTQMIGLFSDAAVLDKTGPSLGIASADMLLHGNDLARATGQDDTIPDELAQAAFDVVNGNFTDDNRKGVFKPEIDAPENASAQEKLLAYSGRPPRI